MQSAAAVGRLHERALSGPNRESVARRRSDSSRLILMERTVERDSGADLKMVFKKNY